MRLDPLLDNGVETIPVTLGTMTETDVEGVSGLSEGDVVVVPDGSSETSDETFEGPPGGQIPIGGMFRGG
jgi:hypothetical protein